MSDVLKRIKRAILAGNYAFSEKARIEMEMDRLTELDVAESILNAVAIYKTLRSTSPRRGSACTLSRARTSTAWRSTARENSCPKVAAIDTIS